MSKDYKVKVSKCDCTRAERIVVTLNDDKIFESEYWRFWGKGRRLYILPSSPENGIKKTERGQVATEKTNYVSGMTPFVGEYDVVHYDDVTKLRYVDLDDCRKVDKQRYCKGISHNVKTRNAEYVKKNYEDVEEEEMPIENTNVVINPDSNSKSVIQKLLTAWVEKKLSDKKYADATKVIEIIQMLDDIE